ncbi:hypothetical protein BDN72DRAFT_835960 [Pluteus cervinus]|uniref:Uncharacterized protein n=1 Tax=Pluteus cervinus TaxID=181527 RepID=A0ACD3B4B7_9AGAR|nr:hypothetical protein BDN72DRAFT_835960 [Pluteus cervinus]
MDLDTSFGPLLIGGLISTALWGVTCVQTYIYFTRKSRDGPAYKAVIAFLFVLCTVDSMLTGYILYYDLVTHSADPLASVAGGWSYTQARSIVSFLSDFIIRTMFAIRLYKFSKNNVILVTWIMTLSLVAFAAGLFCIIQILRINSFERLHEFSNIVSLIFATNALADFSIATSLCYMLHRSRTGFRRTDSLIRLLMIYTLNTGVIFVVDAIPTLVAFVTMPQNLIYNISYLPSAKLHLNSYLACLNARESIREKFEMQDPILVESQLSSGILGRARAPSIESSALRSGSGVPAAISLSVARSSLRRASQ